MKISEEFYKSQYYSRMATPNNDFLTFDSAMDLYKDTIKNNTQTRSIILSESEFLTLFNKAKKLEALQAKELLEELERQIVEWGYINANTTLLMKIRKAIKELSND